MGTDQFLERWSKAMGAAVKPPHSVWAERFRREGSALMACPAKDGGCLLILIATDRAAEQVLDFIVRKAFAIDRFERIWGASSEEVFGVDDEVLSDLGIGVWQAYRVSEEVRAHADEVFERLTTVERSRLPSTVEWNASTGSLIRSLRGAVARSDREAVRAHLSELKGRGLADRFHFDFLSLWSKAKLEPADVASSQELSTVLDSDYSVPIPRALLQVVAGAVLDSSVARPGDDGAGGRELAELVREGRAPFPESLFQRGGLLPTAEGAVFRALSSIGSGERVLWSGDEELIQGRVGDSLLAELPATGPKLEPASQPAPQVQDPNADDILLLSLCRELASKADEPATVAQDCVLKLIQFADRGDGYATKEVRGWWERLEPGAKSEWASRSNFLADWLEVPEGPAADSPICWLGWLKLLSAGQASPDEAGSGFSYEDLPLFENNQFPESEALASVLGELASSAELSPRLFEVLPALLEAWEVSDLAAAHCDRVSQSLAEAVQYCALITEDALSARNSVALVYRFLEVGLGCGLSSGAYKTVVGELAERIESLASPGLLKVLLDVFELLTDQKRPHGDSFLRCARAFSQAASRHHVRVDADELSLIAELLRSAGMSAEAESLEALIPEDSKSADADEEGISLKGQNILIYTLVEGAGHRAEERIKKSLHAKVRRNSDHAASASLKADLEWANIVICVTRAAQHAATGEIDRRTPENALIRPLGKGSSSILNALNEWRRRQSA